MERQPSRRIQTSVLNGIERKVLVSMAGRMPGWVTSDMLTAVGVFGAVVVALGYFLSNYNINFLWIASLGFLINWFGDSMDGTLARVRNCQRPIYGFFLDHNIDGITITIMCIGAGLSELVSLYLAMGVLIIYLLLSIYVYINAHLKNEFKLTYSGMGPTEFRAAVIIINTLFIYITPLREYRQDFDIFGHMVSFTIFDYICAVILVLLIIFHIGGLLKDGRYYANADKLPGRE